MFAWPSRLEGFGLPPVEAIWTGCTVAASRAPVMPEVLGTEAPVYFDPDRPAELADALTLLGRKAAQFGRHRVRAGRNEGDAIGAVRVGRHGHALALQRRPTNGDCCAGQHGSC